MKFFLCFIMSTCIIGAMSCELEKIREIYNDKFGEPEICYLTILDGEIVKVDKNIIECKHPLEQLGDRSVSYYFVPNPDFKIPTYRLEKYGKDHFIFHTYVRNGNANKGGIILKELSFDKNINIGLSGALKHYEREGDIITPTKLSFADISKSGLKYYNGEELRDNIKINGSITGTEVTSNVFFSDDIKKYFNENFPDCVGVDMESFILAEHLKHNIKIVRYISDGLGKNSDYFLTNIDEIIDRFNKKIESLESILI